VTSGYQAVLDACVLVNAALRDTLLRIAEPPRLYLPRWSSDIMSELTRTLQNKRGLSPEQTTRLAGQLREHFGDCWVEGYEPLIAAMGNHPKDRHVLAAAVRTGAQTIVTFNLKDFATETLAPWDVEAQHPDDFLVHQFHLNPAAVLHKVQEQAEQRGGIERLLTIHAQTVPVFTTLLRESLSL
jgi:predicted nucleic acid-binding protein